MLDIERFLESPGWAVIGVFSDRGNNVPGFSYTVGLTARGLPELITLGLPSDAAHHILNDAARRLLAGNRFEPGQRLHEIANMPLTVRVVDDTDARRTGYAAFRRYPEGCRFLQLVWPDRAGLFPGDPDCEPRFVDMQDITRVVDNNDTLPSPLSPSNPRAT
jgi:hypothetical protein